MKKDVKRERTEQARTRITQTAEAAAAAATTKRKRWRVLLGSLRCVFIFMNDVSAHRFVPYNSATKRQKQLSFMWLLYLRFFVIVAVVAKKAKRQPKATARRVALIDQLLCNCISAGLRVCVLKCLCVWELLAHTKPKSGVASFFLGKRARIERVREREGERKSEQESAPTPAALWHPLALSLSVCLFYYNINSFFGQWPKQRSLLR